MKTKVIPRASRRKKVDSIQTIATIGESLIHELPQLQTGSYDGCFYEWSMKALIEIFDRGVIPTGNKIQNFFERYACRVSPFNVPQYLQQFK